MEVQDQLEAVKKVIYRREECEVIDESISMLRLRNDKGSMFWVKRELLEKSGAEERVLEAPKNCERYANRAYPNGHPLSNPGFRNKRSRGGTSRFKGVSRDNRTVGLWCVYASFRGERFFLGRFESEEDAARCYNRFLRDKREATDDSVFNQVEPRF